MCLSKKQALPLPAEPFGLVQRAEAARFGYVYGQEAYNRDYHIFLTGGIACITGSELMRYTMPIRTNKLRRKTMCAARGHKKQRSLQA
jgi:hypothetical protein